MIILLFGLNFGLISAQWSKKVVDTIESNDMYYVLYNLMYRGDTLITGSENLWFSFDNGQTWIKKPLPQFPSNTHISGLGFINDTIFVALAKYGIYLTWDWGNTWIERNNGIIISFDTTSGAYDYPSHIFVFDDLTFASNSRHFYYSTNRGQDWIILDTVLRNKDIFVSASNITKQGKEIWVVAAQGVIYSSDGGANWVKKLSGPFEPLSILISKTDEIFVGTSRYGITYSSDYGQNWTPRNRWLPFKNVSVASIAEYEEDIFIGTITTSILYSTTTYPGLFVSTDRGDNWHRIIFDSTNFKMYGDRIFIRNDTIIVVPYLSKLTFYMATVKGVLSLINMAKDPDKVKETPTGSFTLPFQSNESIKINSYRRGAK